MWTWCICRLSGWKSEHVVFNSLIEEGDEDKDEDEKEENEDEDQEDDEEDDDEEDDDENKNFFPN